MTDPLDDEQMLALNAALEAEPDNPEHFYTRGKRRAELGDTSGAIQDFDRAIALSPRNPAYYVERGNCYYELGDTKRRAGDSRSPCPA